MKKIFRNAGFLVLGCLFLGYLPVYSTPETDLAELTRLSSEVCPALKQVISDELNTAKKVVEWQQVPTSGNAIPLYNAEGKLISFQINYQSNETKPVWERMGNFAHEIMHAVVLDSYNRDFINYTNAADKPLPEPVFKKYKGLTFVMTNQADRQFKQANRKADEKIGKNAEELLSLVSKSGLPADKQKMLNDKINYIRQWPAREYETCLVQMMIWCHYWKADTKSSFYLKLNDLLENANYRRKTQSNFVVVLK